MITLEATALWHVASNMFVACVDVLISLKLLSVATLIKIKRGEAC